MKKTNLFDMFNSFNGAEFIGINNYKAKTTGEIANHVINTNISVESAKKKDLATLKSVTEQDLQMLVNQTDIPLDVYKTALSEMIESAVKNLSKNIEEHTTQSQAITNVFISLTKNGSVKLHKETLVIYIFGLHVSKKVLVEGEYKKVNSSPKTIAKNKLTKHLNLRAGKFRTYILNNAEILKVSGSTIEL